MNYNFPIAFIDAPEILDASVTHVPARTASPLQVIADSGTRSAVRVDFIDTTGDFIGVYLGTSGNEILLCIIGGGLNGWAWGVFPAHSRVSIKSMTAVEITNGTLTMSLMSY